MGEAARAIHPPIFRSRNVASVALAAALALLAGALAVRSMQIAVTLALLVLLLAVRIQSRPAGLTLLWTYWLLAPFLRRVLDLTVAAPGADPLSLLPFLGTAALALLELRENRLDRRARLIMTLAALGIVLGVPVGLATDPAAASFATVAYIAGLSAFVLGWGDGVRPASPASLHRVLAVALIPLSLYAIAQYFFSLTSWDANWVASAELASIGAPQEGHIRVFSTLNSPFTFAIVLAIGVILGLGVQRRLSTGIAVTLPLLVALALTFVRSAWLAVVVGVLVFAGAARGRSGGRIAAVVAICLLALVTVGGSNPTTSAFTRRVTSLGNPEEDVSARERLETTKRLLPTSLSQPLGAGLGQAGLAVRLEQTGHKRAEVVDDGYLSLMYQAGPFGFLLVLMALIASVRAAVQALSRAELRDRPARAALLASLVALLVALASADVFFGLPGAILWYLCGLAVASASRERHEIDRPEQPLETT
jgi:hypothetical protein